MTKAETIVRFLEYPTLENLILDKRIGIYSTQYGVTVQFDSKTWIEYQDKLELTITIPYHNKVLYKITNSVLSLLHKRKHTMYKVQYLLPFIKVDNDLYEYTKQIKLYKTSVDIGTNKVLESKENLFSCFATEEEEAAPVQKPVDTIEDLYGCL